jgi:fatty-acyl-CoA synthase
MSSGTGPDSASRQMAAASAWASARSLGGIDSYTAARTIGWANSSADPGASTSAARSRSASRAAAGRSRLASAAACRSGAGPPRTASARVSGPASGTRRSTARATCSGAWSTGAPSRNAAASASSRNGFPPVLAWHSRHSSSPARSSSGAPSRQRTSAAAASGPSGPGRSRVPSARSSSSRGSSSWPSRTASSSATGKPCSSASPRAVRIRAPGPRQATRSSVVWVVHEFAAGLAGLTLVTVNPAYQAEELAHVLGHSGSAGVFLRSEEQAAILAGVQDRLPLLREVFTLGLWPAGDGEPLPGVDAAGPAQILFTSGTTGRPKAAVLTHQGLTNNARLAAEAIGLRADDVLVNPMPYFHVAGGGMITLGLVQTLGTHVVMPRFDPALMLELTEKHRGTLIGGVPMMLTALLAVAGRAPRDLSSVRLALAGGATVPPELVRQIEAAFGVPFTLTFGQTESSCSITITRPSDTADDRAETLGRPPPQTEVKIVNLATGKTVPCGTIGEICTRGYLVMAGYLGDQEATAAAIDAEGWLHTGDLGSMDERGYCRIAGRLKEMIIRGGENIYPREIEAVLLSHPGVAEVAVVGVPDRFWGEVVGAVVRPASAGSAGETELADYCRGRLAAYKTPVRWLFTEGFPLTSTGKVRKDVLSAQLAEVGLAEAGLAEAGLSASR